MATLEKIRSKQKLLFTIVIGALVLFIISIADASSIRNIFGVGPGSTVAKVGDVKVDYETYSRRSEQVSQQNQNQNQDNDVLKQQTIQQLLIEGLLAEQYNQLGIKVTDAEISRAMIGETPHPSAQQFIASLSQALGLPTTDGATLYKAITNPGMYNLTKEQLDMMAQQYLGAPTMLTAWANQEKNVEEAIKQQVFGSLISGLFTANELDAKTAYDHNTNVAIVSYVTSPFSSVSDDEIEVSEADLKAKYDELRSNFYNKQPSRLVDYIVVNVVPSREDYAAAEVEVDKAVETLRTDSNAVLAARFISDNIVAPAADIKTNRQLAGMPDSLVKKGSVYKFPMMQNTYRVAKVNDITAQIDSINISFYYAETQAKIDSVMTQIQNGETSLKALAEEFPQQAADSLWQSLVGSTEDIVKVLTDATVGQPFAYNDSTANAHAIFNVNKRKAPKQYADITLFTYTVDPSNTTTTDIYTNLSSFVASNSNADLFSANADSLYHLRSTTIDATTPKLGYAPGYQGMSSGTPGTRHAIQWAMNAKKGEVSPIFDDNNGQYYVVVAVKDIYDGDYIPFSAQQVQDQLRPLVVADKKGAKLVEKYKGKASDLAGFAQQMNTEIVNDSNVVFSSPRLGTFGGNEYRLQAQIAGAKPGTLVGPVAGANEVMVFVVDGVNKNERPYNFTQDGQTFMGNFGFNDPFSLLAGKNKVKNNLLKFENYDR